MHTLMASPLPFSKVIQLTMHYLYHLPAEQLQLSRAATLKLDLEAQAIDFGLRRFRQYIVGGPPIDIITDHRPLESIFASTRLGSIRTDRIKLRHQDIDFNVKWRSGRINPADYLSRHATPMSKAPKTWRKETSELEKTIWYLQFSPYTESISMATIIAETKNGTLLGKLKQQLSKGYIPKTMIELSPFRKFFRELTISDEGLILKGAKIILPEKLWTVAFNKAHQGGHPGMNSLKRRLRNHFWFPTQAWKFYGNARSRYRGVSITYNVR